MPKPILLRRRGGHVVPPQMPIFSRGVTTNASNVFGGSNAPANANDSDYGTFFRSVVSPNGGTPQWLTYDLRGISSVAKTNVWCYWKNPTVYFQGAATLGSDAASAFVSLPRNYVLQYHTFSGSEPASNDVGWTNLATAVTDNRYSRRLHTGLNMSAANWFRFYCTASNGVTSSTDDIRLQLDLRDVSAGTSDSIFVYGDSISSDGFNDIYPGNGTWTGGGMENLLESATGRVCPVIINGSTPGWQASTGDTNKATFIGAVPCKYVIIAFGSNDANGANIDLTSLGGATSTYALAYKASMQSMVDYCVSLGKLVLIPYIPWGDTSTWSAPNVGYLNTCISQIRASNPSTVFAGPDLYSFFQAHPNALVDHLHPTYDPAVSGGLVNGLSGYENFRRMWRDSIVANLY